MNRRGFFASVLASGVAAPAYAANEHTHDTISGDRASATVSFGNWQTDPPFDRHPANNDRLRNGHTLTPFEARIRAGGTVNFIIAGFHQVQIYAPGTKPDDIRAALEAPIPPVVLPTNGGPPLINIPTNRVYRGIDPSTMPLLRFTPPVTTPPTPPSFLQDRTEVVQLTRPGRYLVICGVVPHFATDGMFGWIRVDRRGRDD